jgi:short-chain fatty acids transporter
MALGWINWALGIVGGAVLARLFARRVPQLDLRLIVAVAYLGLGCTWHAGLSASAPLLVATPGHFLEGEIGLIPTHLTLFHPFNLLLTVAVLISLTFLVWQLARWTPLSPEQALAQRVGLGGDPSPEPVAAVSGKRPSLASVLDRGYWLNGLLGACGLAWVVTTWLDNQLQVTFNSINFLLLFLGITLHPSPDSVGRSAKEAVAFVHGIILQFPLYAGMFGIIKGTGLSEILGNAFVSIASARTLPILVYWYSGIVNYFVPSGGSKWAIEAPYLVAAAENLGVPIHQVVLAYSWGDMATNLLHPFWALPLITATGLEFREILGYGIVIFCFYFSLVSLALWFFL